MGIGISVFGQSILNDTIIYPKKSPVSFENIALPMALTVYGFASLCSNRIRNVDFSVRNLTGGKDINRIDDYLIYVPLAADIGLSVNGYESKHNFKEKIVLYCTATILNAMLVYPIKKLISRPRPDNSDLRSFPSGHTSNAFVGAEYFWQEYSHKSEWLAISGYLVATTTGYFRLHNNKHWFSDVLVGAGIGILSAKISYWLFPMVNKTILPSKHYSIYPITTPDFVGLNVIYHLK